MPKIKALADIESIQKRPGWIIGKTDTPEQLVHEVLDNALDELVHDYATDVSLIIGDERNDIWVADSGRGIEISNVEFDGKSYDSIVLLCTKLFSGSKFEMTQEEYSSSIGQHGVGLTAVNALSEWLVIHTRDRKDKRLIHTYTFKDSKFIEKQINPDGGQFAPFNTFIGFKPSAKFFDTVEIDSSVFEKRLKLASAKFAKGNFYLNQQQIKMNSMEDFIKSEFGIEEMNLLNYRSSIDKDKQISIWITYTDDDEKFVMGDVNLKVCEGKYLDYIQADIKKILSETYKDLKVKNLNDLLIGLKLYVSLRFPEPEFDAQTKTRMESRKVKPLIDKIKPRIESFVNRPDILEIIRINVNKKHGKKLNKSFKKISFENKLRDCKKIPGDVLYLLEGDSADGTLKEIKNTETEASLPLRGKVLNVEKATMDQILKNVEIRNIIEALGEPSNRRYKKIKILCDADCDGMHIIVLLILALQKFAKDMIKDGKVSIILPPLFGARKNDKYIPIYDENDLAKYRNKGYSINRFKGLGEMNPSDLEVTIRSGVEYKLKWPSDPSKLESLLEIIKSSELKRRIMNDPKLDIKIILNEAIANSKIQ